MNNSKQFCSKIVSRLDQTKIARIERIIAFTLTLWTYRVVKQNFQVVRFRDFEHVRAKMAEFFCTTSRHNIYLLI